MDRELRDQRLKALKELESCIEQIDPKTFDRDRSLQEIAQGLEEQNVQLQSISEALKTMIVISLTPEPMRSQPEVIDRNYILYQKKGLI